MSSTGDSDTSDGKRMSWVTVEVDEDSSSSWESLDEEGDEDFCHLISQNTVILGRVFAQLTVHELLKCRLVNKLWNTTALLQNNLGSKTCIRVDRSNIARLNQTTDKMLFPFCRQFILDTLNLDETIILSFNKIFKNCISSLSLDCCTASVTSKIVPRLLKAPHLREVKITGALPDFSSTTPFRTSHLARLVKIELCSSDKHGQVSPQFIKTLIQNSTNLKSISIGNGYSLWKDFVELALDAKLRINELKLCNLMLPLDIDDFQFLRCMRLCAISFQDCIVFQNVLQGILEMTGNHLHSLCILGAQHEILTRNFIELCMPNLTYLTLPIDGISADHGEMILRAMPNLLEIKVVGLFHTKFIFQSSRLAVIDINGYYCHNTCVHESQLDLGREKRREFYKIISILSQQPTKLRVNLQELNSSCLRRIYQNYPDIQELVVLNNARNCLDGWTGIPIKRCRKISSCRSFAVLDASTAQKLSSVSRLKKLRRLEISILKDPPKAEFTLLYILYGICQLPNLEELRLNNFTISDVAFVALDKALRLKACYINGSQELWNYFKTSYQATKVKSFLLPPKSEPIFDAEGQPLKSSKILQNIFRFLPHHDVYNFRLVSNLWHRLAIGFLHAKCDSKSRTLDMNKYFEESKTCQAKNSTSPNKTPRRILNDTKSGTYVQVLKILKNTPSLTKLVIRGMNKSLLEHYQRENLLQRSFKFSSCEDRRNIIYWFYPDGNDELLVPCKTTNPEPTSLILIGSWGRKDTGLLEFLETSQNICSIILHGLLQEVYDVILPRVTAIRNLESLAILPFSSAGVTEINRNHLQILSNSSFSLKTLIVQKLQAPPDTIADLVRSHRYTLEILEIQNNVNVSDRLSFTIPHLKILYLDEPPGALLWTSLNINQSVETVHFERSGYIYNQIKSKAMPKMELVDQDFEHCATNMLCDVNLFLECVSNKRPGVQKSILQEGTDSALKFFSHFRFLTSLTLRSVHAHYGILQGIFRNFDQLEKLVFTNTTGITDEILTGIPQYLLNRMDLMNPLCFKKMQNGLNEFSNPSIRNLKNLTYLSLDDQTTCTDLSVIFGIVRLKRLEYFSCKKWKITDITMRSIIDMTSIKHMITDGCTGISSYGETYFRDKTRHRLCS